jgi:hypothetical protein
MTRSITVAVGSPDNLRSSIWRLWVQGDEVYFGALQLMPALKVSLHKSGKWHIAWCKSVTGRDRSNRVVCKWRRPPPTRGLVSGISVVVDPYFPKQPFMNKAITDPEIKWLPLALYGKVLGLKTVIATKEADLDSSRLPPNERILARIPKSNGENVLLISEVFTPPPWVWSSIAKWRAEITIHCHKDKFEEARFFDTTRALSISLPSYPHEAPAIYDLLLGWENVVADPE